jgi:hypothetical protein
MAASSFVPAHPVDRRRVAAAAAARTAPRGAGLAAVVALPLAPVPDQGVQDQGVPDQGVQEQGLARRTDVRALTLVPDRRRTGAPGTRARRLGFAVLAVALLLATVGVGVAATAQQAPLEAAGHVVLQPGETLWDVALRSAGPGVDPRRQLDDLRRLNAFGPEPLDAWTVVLIPAR